MNIIALPLAVPFLAFAYRLRGGGWVSLDDWEYRLIWGMALVLSYIAFSFPDPNPAYCMTSCAWPASARGGLQSFFCRWRHAPTSPGTQSTGWASYAPCWPCPLGRLWGIVLAGCFLSLSILR
jgi:hypothetical protein